MSDYTPVIPKEQLIVGAYYKGRCRNASVARWDGKVFHHWRRKFGTKFVETIKCPEDDDKFDVFVAEELLEPHEVEGVIDELAALKENNDE